jgi:hypothetical protein
MLPLVNSIIANRYLDCFIKPSYWVARYWVARAERGSDRRPAVGIDNGAGPFPQEHYDEAKKDKVS